MAKNELAAQNTFKSLLNTREMVKQMDSACGGEREAKEFMASMLEMYNSSKDLQRLDPQEVLVECLKAADLNLPLTRNLGWAYVVPFGNKPTFVIGYQGLIQLALRSGQYVALNADAIYEGEIVEKDRLSGKIVISGQKKSDNPIGYFAYFKLINGYEQTIYMTKEELEAYGKKNSPSYSKGPWQTNFDEMAKKTLIRKILKYGPMSTAMREAERIDVVGAEISAQATVEQNANNGEIIDIPLVDADPVAVDETTGEVVSEPEF